jgi:outer membrane protein OmpA-like peptidoglycan-associated protein
MPRPATMLRTAALAAARRAPVLLALALVAAAARPARAADAPTTLAPERMRTTDSVIARDLAALAALDRRLAAYDTVTAPRRVYTHTLAHGWHDIARDQYALHDRSGLVDAAFEHASVLASLLEKGTGTLESLPRAVPGTVRLREDLWQLGDSLKRTEALRCVAGDIARLEVALLMAEHEATVCRTTDPHPLAARLAAQALVLRRRAETCIIPVAIAPAPAPELPEPSPSPIPTQVEIALKRLAAMNNVHFELKGITISAASAQVLDSVAVVLHDVPEVTAVLIGHTDPRGSVAYNLALGRRRALAVRDYLAHAGVDTARFAIASEGKGSPVAIGSGTLEYALNRRVEIQYMGPGNVRIEARAQERDLQLERKRTKAGVPARKRPPAKATATEASTTTP